MTISQFDQNYGEIPRTHAAHKHPTEMEYGKIMKTREAGKGRDHLFVENGRESDGKYRTWHLIGSPEGVLEGVYYVGIVDADIAGKQIPAERSGGAHKDQVLLRRQRQLSRRDLRDKQVPERSGRIDGYPWLIFAIGTSNDRVEPQLCALHHNVTAHGQRGWCLERARAGRGHIVECRLVWCHKIMLARQSCLLPPLSA